MCDVVWRMERIYCIWCVYETLSFMGTCALDVYKLLVLLVARVLFWVKMGYL
jgi:hypothetical protein